MVVRCPSGFIGEPEQTEQIPEDPKDYFEVVTVDAGGNVVDGIKGLVHPDVLTYMNEVEPKPDGYYLLPTVDGRISYKLEDQ
jgi:hypothetical protein